MCDAYFDSGKYRGPETDPDGWHVRAVLGVNNDENVVIQSQNCNRATATKNKYAISPIAIENVIIKAKTQ